ncbi:MAG: hypothetical protein GY855_04980 [candidate division Zixibacteria bacterium]|nr:hypothetical protein [candidate division Zixibacteria bacterium]
MMKIFKIIFVLAIITALAVISNSCGKRTNPVEMAIVGGADYSSSFNDTASLWFNYMGNNSFREISIYTPPDYDPLDSVTFYPVLYLLHGFGGDHDYFTHLYGLNAIADEMIAKDEIQPMIIATIDGSSQLGGGWYTDTDSFGVITVIDTLYFRYTLWDDDGNPIDSMSVEDTVDVTRYFAGLYEKVITRDLKNQVESNFNVYTDRGHVGIGGHSMGGYGAMKIAMKSSDLFGSISSMSAPLAFPGDGSSFFGLLNFIPTSLAEMGLTTSNSAAVNESLFFHFTLTSDMRITSMMLSMASVFSPHQFADPDTSRWFRLTTAGPIGVDLPFDWTYIDSAAVATPIDTIWNQWLEHDCLTMLSSNAAYAAALDSVDIYIDCGDNDDLLLKYHNDIFDAALTAASIDHEYEVYSGYSGNSARHANLISARLREVLKFHSNSFE